MEAIKGVLFDKDGTLLDFAATWLPSFREAALAVTGKADDRIECLLAVGGYNSETQSVAAGSLFAAGNNAEIAAAWADHMPGCNAADLARQLDRIFSEIGARYATPVPEVGPLLARLKARGLRLGVATSDSLQGARATLADFGILEQLDFLAGYDSGYGIKPEPGMVQGFCRETRLQASEVAVVGDNLHDLEMGRRAGAGLLVGVLTGNGTEADLVPHADHVLASVVGLDGLLFP